MKCLSVKLFVLIGLFLLSFHVTAQVDIPVSSIDSIFIDVDRPGSPGCALTVIQDGEIVYSRGYGYANLDHGIPIDSKTVLNLGSITKQFVAAGILNASIDGILSLNDDISKWIPEFPDYGSPITIRHLIHHTSGIRDHVQLMAVGNLPDDMTQKEIVDLLARQKALNFNPGEQWLYSNSGYFLLAEILERSSGLTVQEYLNQEFFKPLAISTAYFGRYDGIIPQASMSYWSSEKGFRRVKHVGDVRGVRINADDMARWMIALEADQLGPPGFREMQLQTGILKNGDPLHYAFGLNRLEHRGLQMISHGGSANGFRSGMAIYPDQKVSICAMCNLSNLDPVARIRQVAEVILGDIMEAVEPMSETSGFRMPWPAPAGDPLQLNKDQLTELEGRYYSPELKVVFHVKIEEDRLRVGPEDWMRPMSTTSKPDLFNDGRAWAQIRFQRNEKGEVDGFVMDIGRVSGLIIEKLPEEEFPGTYKN